MKQKDTKPELYLTVKEMSEKIGVSERSVLGRLERKKIKPNFKILNAGLYSIESFHKITKNINDRKYVPYVSEAIYHIFESKMNYTEINIENHGYTQNI